MTLPLAQVPLSVLTASVRRKITAPLPSTSDSRPKAVVSIWYMFGAVPLDSPVEQHAQRVDVGLGEPAGRHHVVEEDGALRAHVLGGGDDGREGGATASWRRR